MFGLLNIDKDNFHIYAHKFTYTINKDNFHISMYNTNSHIHFVKNNNN